MPGLVSLAESNLSTIAKSIEGVIPNFLLAIVALVIIFVFYEIVTFFVRHWLRHSVKKQHDQKMFLSLWRYGFVFLAIVLAIIGFSGSLTALGLSVGFFSLVLGWALQKPITGVAAWLTIVFKKPFRVGDRIVINNIKGDVADITPFYIILNESGGLVEGEDNSGRSILFPTSVLFDQPIVNYTFEDQYILNEVTASVTYESNIRKARKVCEEAASEATREYLPEVLRKPLTRIVFKASGIDVKVKFYAPVQEKERIATDITQAIYDKFMKSTDLDFAYPHTKFVFGRKEGKKLGKGLS